jgi:MFS family permease
MNRHAADSRYATMRLLAALALMTVGNGAMYIVTVVLPTVQRDFGVARADASLPYTLLMIGFGLGGLLMGRLADRFGVTVPLLIGAASIGLGFALASVADSIWTFALAHGVRRFLGSSTTFAPLIADTSLWFVRRRGIAVAVCASGNYVAGAVWPPIVQHFVQASGWRATYFGLGVFCAVTIALLALLMRERPPVAEMAPVRSGRATPARAAVRPLAACRAGAAVHRRPRLLRGDGNAASPHRRAVRGPASVRRAARRCSR